MKQDERAYANATRDSSNHVRRHWNGNFMVYKTEVDCRMILRRRSES